MKKAQGLSVDTIIIAAIALLVLVILSVIFIGRIGTFGQSADRCENKGGRCFSEECADTTDYPLQISAICPEERPNCCIPIR